MLQTLRRWAKLLKGDIVALWFACRHPQTPWYAKLFTALVVAYAFSPIDLIPDFIPVLGLLDEAVLLPIGVWLAVRMIPPDVMDAARARAREGKLPANWIAGVLILLLWAASIAAIVWWLVNRNGMAPPAG